MCWKICDKRWTLWDKSQNFEIRKSKNVFSESFPVCAGLLQFHVNLWAEAEFHWWKSHVCSCPVWIHHPSLHWAARCVVLSSISSVQMCYFLIPALWSQIRRVQTGCGFCSAERGATSPSGSPHLESVAPVQHLGVELSSFNGCNTLFLVLFSGILQLTRQVWGSNPFSTSAIWISNKRIHPGVTMETM